MSELTKEIDAPKNNDQVVGWITEHLKKHKFLLAFADDGVIWGKMDGEDLVTSNDIDPNVSPKLRGKTLQQAFLFDEKEEIRLFRDEIFSDENVQWQARLVRDGGVFINESHILWGDRAYPSQRQFTHVFNARQQGLDLIVPIEVEYDQIDPGENLENDQADQETKGEKCIRLDIHHTVNYSKETGEAYIAVSRLVELRVGNRNEEVKNESGA